MTNPKATYNTTIIGDGQHASIDIPDSVLAQIGGNRRAPLKVTVNGYTYQSTATGVGGRCRVVFPTKDRLAAGAKSGDNVDVTLELDSGYRHVNVPQPLSDALQAAGLSITFHDLVYSKRKEFARQVAEAKADDTRALRIQKVIDQLR